VPRQHFWIQSIRCIVCNKTGKISDPENPEKEIKCYSCGGDGYHTTKGSTKAD
jgi:hypothetical protein